MGLKDDLVESMGRELPMCPLCSRPALDQFKYPNPRQGRLAGRWFLDGCRHASDLTREQPKGNFDTRPQAVDAWRKFIDDRKA